MKPLLERLFVENWQRKLISLAAALIIWILVNHSITVTRTLPDVPVRIVGLPSDKTVEGLLPTGFLSNRLNITVRGSKAVVQDLTSNNVEILLDARDKGDQWVAHIDKKTLASVNPEIDLGDNISDVTGNDFIITLSQLVTEKIPITVIKPIGEPPPGYQYLDTWPQRLYQTVSGPKVQVEELKSRGLELTFDLGEISASQLNLLESAKGPNTQDEISFIVPQSWKRVAIPFLNDTLQDINDPDAEHLRIDFLRKEFLPLDLTLPVSVFFPVESSAIMNPETYTLSQGPQVTKENGIFLLTTPLYVRDVSRLFLDLVRNNLELVIVAIPPEVSKGSLPWSVQFVNPGELETTYVRLASAELNDKKIKGLQPQLRDSYLRNRFRNYMRQLELFIAPDKKLQLDIQVEDHSITVKKATS